MKAIKAHYLKLTYSINGCNGYVKWVTFVEYDNGQIRVSDGGKNRYMSKKAARNVYCKYQEKGYKPCEQILVA